MYISSDTTLSRGGISKCSISSAPVCDLNKKDKTLGPMIGLEMRGASCGLGRCSMMGSVSFEEAAILESHGIEVQSPGGQSNSDEVDGNDFPDQVGNEFRTSVAALEAAG